MRLRIFLGKYKPHINLEPIRGHHPWVCRWHSPAGPTFYGRGATPAKAWDAMQDRIKREGYKFYAARG